MADRIPTSAVNIIDTWDGDVLIRGEPNDVMPWDDVRDRIARAGDYWVSTVRANRSPHVRPVFAVWVDGMLVSTTNGTRAKARNLASNWPLVIREGAYHAPFAAPVAGPPPYRPYAVTPEVVYGMGITDDLAPRSTRYRF